MQYRWRRIAVGCVLTLGIGAFPGCTRLDTPVEMENVRQAMANMEESATEAVETTVCTTTVTTFVTTTTTITTTTEPLAAPVIEMDGNIDPAKPMVALTFDDGPGKGTSSVLDTLAAYGARATFFIVGQNVTENNGELLARAQELHCEVGSHTLDHSDLTGLTPAAMQDNLHQADEAIFRATGTYAYWLRPPYGAFNDMVQQNVGKPMAYWSVDTKDWKTKNAASTVQAATLHIEDGDVVLMHDIYTQTADAVQQIVPTLIQKGYQLVTMSELMYYRDVEIQPGMVVFSMHPEKYNYKLVPEEAGTTAGTEIVATTVTEAVTSGCEGGSICQ